MVNNTYNTGDTGGEEPGCLQVAFVAALVYNPTALVIWFLYSHPLSPQCFAGPFCTFDQFPGILQLALVLLSMAVTWFLAWGVIRVGLSLDAPRGLWARLISRAAFRELRSALAACGGLLLLMMIVTLLSGRATLVLVMLGLLTSLLMLALAVASIPAREASAQPTVRGASPFANVTPNQTRPLNQAGTRTAGAAAATNATAGTANTTTNATTNTPTNATNANTTPPPY